jgi:hypothetical protein
LLTVNLFHLTLRSTLTSTATLWDAWKKNVWRKRPDLGATTTTTGSFITTTRPPTTLPSKPHSLWLTTWLLFLILPIRRT